MFQIIAKIWASNPPTIGMTLGGIGMMLGMPYAGWIFGAGVGLQLLWLGLFRI